MLLCCIAVGGIDNADGKMGQDAGHRSELEPAIHTGLRLSSTTAGFIPCTEWLVLPLASGSEFPTLATHHSVACRVPSAQALQASGLRCIAGLARRRRRRRRRQHQPSWQPTHPSTRQTFSISGCCHPSGPCGPSPGQTDDRYLGMLSNNDNIWYSPFPSILGWLARTCILTVQLWR